MNRFKGLFRDTWWLWVALCCLGGFLAWRVSFVFMVTYPISLFSFIYFGLLRYDNDGNPKEGF